MTPTPGVLKVGLLLLFFCGQGFAAADNFVTCIDKWRAQAVAEGIDQVAVDAVLQDVEPLQRVIKSDRSQAEFTRTFADYYSRRVTQGRVDTGRSMLVKHQSTLTRVLQDTGVPPHYLMALWGLETNFGTYFGKLAIPSALATLACDKRRGQYFGKELLATMRIVANKEMRAQDLIGSWAGAIGHMQFMPTTFEAYAVDGDGDGKRDLMNNVQDALASGGNYVNHLGWNPGYRWGREVSVPEQFDYSKTGSDKWRPLKDWQALGVTDVFGNVLPAADIEAALLLPTGHKGPAFLVYPNFRVIMGWNRSEYYAISVGRLADRIAGAGKLHRALPAATDIQFATNAIVELQKALNEQGYATGKPDGVIGPATKKAIQAFQTKLGFVADGYPDADLFLALPKKESS